jgi:hypothetical protein
MSDSPRYLMITLDDGKAIARYLDCVAVTEGPFLDPHEEAVGRIRERLASDTGADMQEIVDKLKALESCGVGCGVLDAHQLGRRLRRLLERARGERDVGPGPPIHVPAGVLTPAKRRDVEEGELRDAGWLPAEGPEGKRQGWWTPPWDRLTPWDFDQAVIEMRRRAAVA